VVLIVLQYYANSHGNTSGHSLRGCHCSVNSCARLQALQEHEKLGGGHELPNEDFEGFSFGDLYGRSSHKLIGYSAKPMPGHSVALLKVTWVGRSLLAALQGCGPESENKPKV
jgi:hypothetical protein